MTNYTDRTVWYCCHPVAPTVAELEPFIGPGDFAMRCAVDCNIQRALRWLRWLRVSFPECTFIAPWIASIMSGDDDSDPAQREAGLVDCGAVAYLVQNAVMVGGRIGSGGRREMDAATSVADLTFLGAEPPEVVTGATFAQWRVRHEPHLHVYAGGRCVCGALDQGAGL